MPEKLAFPNFDHEIHIFKQSTSSLSTVRYVDIAARHYTNTALQAANRLVGRQAD
jgi:hypothetical protein